MASTNQRCLLDPSSSMESTNQTRNPPSSMESTNQGHLLYGINDRPPWGMSIFLAIQQFLTCFSAIFSYPLFISGAICITGDTVGLSELINTVVFVSGLATLIQTTVGIRLPIVQGSSFAYITPIIVLLSQKDDTKCPDFDNPGNETLPFEAGSEAHTAIWKSNLCEVHGSLMVSSLFQMLLGYSGLMNVLVKYIGPLTVAPTISLIGLTLFDYVAIVGSTQWWICFLTVLLIVLFSQCLHNVGVPFMGGKRIKIFSLLPVLFSIILTWLLCLVLTLTDVFPNQPDQWGYQARTDIRTDAIRNAHWFRFPYPGQWGVPTVSLPGVLSMIAATLASIIESIGDYYACAKLCDVPPPPGSAISRGIGAEGLAGMVCGAWGSAGGSTSYSPNIAAIRITKVGSRVVIQLVGFIMILLGCLGKVGALFVMMPDPIVAGLYFVTCGMMISVGISNLQLVDLNSTRNLFVIGLAFFFGMCVPPWIVRNPLDLGNETASQVFTVLFGTSMLGGGVVAFVLDNALPGTLKERGFATSEDFNTSSNDPVYGLPFLQPLINKIKCLRLPKFCPDSSCKENDFGRQRQQHDRTQLESYTTVAFDGDREIPL